jgi:hypothetical protein
MNKLEILKLNVPRLREAAHKVEGLQGISGMNKEQLVRALFEHHGIPLEEATHIVKDPEIKKKIRSSRKEKLEALAAGDGKKATNLTHRLHNLKRETRQWTKAKIRAKAKSKQGA